MADLKGRNLDGSLLPHNFGPFMAITEFLDDKAAYNAMNMSFAIYLAPNSTVSGIGYSALYCPSDDVSSLRYPGKPGDGWDGSPQPMRFTSYAGNVGPLNDFELPNLKTTDPNRYFYSGIFVSGGQQSPGVRDVVDGTSNTILIGEHAHSVIAPALPKADYDKANRWSLGFYGETLFSSEFTPNYFQTNTAPPRFPLGLNNVAMTSASQHAGGAYFLMVDGSVRFIKSTISPATFRGLSTRNGGEVIPDEQF